MASITIAFAGGGTGGHIYPGLAIADELKELAKQKNIDIKIVWIGNKKGMDSALVEKSGSVDEFYGISCGKLRRYFSFNNFLDLFKILAGCISSYFLLKKLKPALLFSKGGFVSVPPCFAAKSLKIPVYTHECDFTPGLATRINSRFATKILLSYEETKEYFSTENAAKTLITGNPVRPVFYNADKNDGLKYLGIEKYTKPILVVVGGSLGAKQINELVLENLQWLTERFIVVHQTGAAFAKEHEGILAMTSENYKPYQFIYTEMPSVLACADVVLSRAGANSLWECAVLGKAMLLIPLSNKGSRGDQVDNAEFFEKRGAAFVLKGEEADSKHLKEALEKLLDEKTRASYCEKALAFSSGERPALKIANLLLEGCGK